jgi:hypothetical protein
MAEGGGQTEANPIRELRGVGDMPESFLACRPCSNGKIARLPGESCPCSSCCRGAPAGNESSSHSRDGRGVTGHERFRSLCHRRDSTHGCWSHRRQGDESLVLVVAGRERQWLPGHGQKPFVPGCVEQASPVDSPRGWDATEGSLRTASTHAASCALGPAMTLRVSLHSRLLAAIPQSSAWRFYRG